MKKLTQFLIIAVSCLLILSFKSLNKDKPAQGNDNNNHGRNPFVLSSVQLNPNNISTWYRNNGSFNRDPSTGNAGFEWPKGSGKTARYASGVWIGCVSGNDTLIAVAEYSYDYSGGYFDDNGVPQGDTNSDYRIYKIERGNTTSNDYLNWPVTQGAYVNNSGLPFFLGTETMFYSYKDFPHTSNNGSIASLGAQILQTNWAYINVNLKNVNFNEFRIINRSNTTWNNAYLAVWTDDDLGTATDDVIGCDTNRNLAFTYNQTDSDPVYGPAPPAVGTVLLRSPIIQTGNMADTVKYYSPPGTMNLVTKVGYKFTGMNVFNTYNNSTPPPADPSDPIETYRVLEGKWETGQSWITPQGDTTKKCYTGDPVTGTGWLMTGGNDRRYLQGFGPFNMNPGDTQSIIVAQVIAAGSSNLNSITHLRDLADYVKTVYDNNFQGVLAVNNISTEIPAEYSLSQNYPNPFNPKTIINYQLSMSNFVTLKVYNLLGMEVSTLVNEKQNAGKYELDFDGSGLSSGVYFYKLETEGFTDTKRMVLIK